MVATLAGAIPVPGSTFARKQFQGDGVQNLAALKAILPFDRFDKQERTVEGPPLEQYFFDAQSAAASNEPDVAVPDDSPANGRWFRHAPGGGLPGTHALAGAEHNQSTLAALNLKVSDAELIDTGDARLSDARTPLAHRASHAGGGDAFLTTDFLEVIVKRLRTTDGPTDMVIGAVADGEFLKRVGATIVGASAGAAPVDSVFGRVGVVVAVSGDYDSDEVTNVSGVFGSTVTVALNTLDNDKLNLVGDTMTGTLTTQHIALVATDTYDIGTTTVAARTIHSRNFQGEDGFAMVIRDGGGNAAFQITQGGTINQFLTQRPGTDNVYSLGAAGKVYVKVFTRTVEIGTGTDTSLSWSTVQTTVSHAILGLDTASRIILVTGRDRVASDYNLAVSTTPIMYFADGGATLTHWASLTHNGVNFVIRSNFGSTEITSTLLTSQVRARVASSLTLSDATGTSVITIADAGDLNFTPTGDVLIGGIKPVLVNGTEPLTAQWNVGDQIISGINALRPDGSSGSKSFGGATNAWGTVFTRKIRADGGQQLTVTAQDGTTVSFKVLTSGAFELTSNMVPSTSGDRLIGSNTLGFLRGFLNNIQPVGSFLTLEDDNGGVALTIGTTTLVVNEGGADKDTRIEGDNDINLGFFDASTDRFGIGTATPATKLDVNGVITSRGDILFDGDNTRDIGAAANRVRNLYANAMVQGTNATFVSMKSKDLGMKFAANDTGIAFFGGSTVAKAAVLTTVDATVIDATYGATEEAVINNTRTRLNDLESRLQAYNLLS